MKRLGVLVPVMALLLSAALASAQEKQPPPNLPLQTLIARPAVQKELKLSEEQTKALTDLAAEARKSLQGSRELPQAERRKKFQETQQKVRAGLEKVLKEEQRQRLTQIDLRQRGATAINQRRIGRDLGLSREQRTKVREVSQGLTETTQKLRKEQRGAELRQQIGKARAEAAGKVLAILTDEQKKAWEKLLGEPFDLSKLRGRR